MDMVLTGRQLGAAEAERVGLVSGVIPADDLLDEATKTASRIADMSMPAVMMAKGSVNRSFESSLAEGVRYERRMFHATFSLKDQIEGMAALIDKRQPTFKHR